MTKENSRLPSPVWMLDRAERLFEKAKSAADPTEASSLRRMATNLLASAEARGAPVGEIRARYRYACPPPERSGAERFNNVVVLQPKRAAVG
jgi:hypothetical protein